MPELILKHDNGVTRCGPFTFTEKGLEVSGNPSFEDWSACGDYLRKSSGASQWWVGDWLNYGEHKYGDKYEKESEETGVPYKTLANYKYVAAAFEFSRRRENLTFRHHAETASLPPEQADAILERASREKLSCIQVRKLAGRARIDSRVAAHGPGESTAIVKDLLFLVDNGDKFGTIYADPPWQYDGETCQGSADVCYQTMAVEEIAALPVEKLAADQCHLHLWTTNGFLKDALGLMETWGFEFKSTFVWAKNWLGLGAYWRCSHEIMLLGVRGGLTFPVTNIKSWIEADRSEHSKKPDKVRSLIEIVSPAPRLELFGRQASNGWTVWGNQAYQQQEPHDDPDSPASGN